MPRKKLDFSAVRDIAMALPGVQESTIHGVPSLTVRGKLLACPTLHKSADPESLVVRIGIIRFESKPGHGFNLRRIASPTVAEPHPARPVARSLRQKRRCDFEL
jgi:hypothetical protein